MRIFFLFIFVIPVIEILLFVWVGNTLGAWTVIGLIFLTAILGVVLAQYQGLENLRKAQEAWQRGDYPTDYMINSICILIGAFLLIIPGFITDAIGLILLIPLTRFLLKKYLLKLLQNMVNRGTFIYWRR
ncbi:MAG TPA: FxsA family protein [Bacillota bacterium]|nr:FxsA family protein [Bacillota bacterium]